MRTEVLRRRRAAALVATALALAVAACGGAGQRDGTGGQAQAPGENDMNPVPRERLADGGTLRWPVDSLPDNYNYHHLDGTEGDTHDITWALMPVAFYAGAAGDTFLNRDLLESAEVTATAPKQVVTYRINPKAIWYDGTPITWRDFEAQWQAQNGANPAYQPSNTNGYSQIERVAQGRDEREAVVTFAAPYGDWDGLYLPLYPASTNGDPNVFNTGWVNQPINSGGPFRLERVDQTAKTVTLVRNERWWGDPPKLERIVYREIDEDAWVDALANGEIDWIDVGPNVNAYQRAQTIEGVELRTAGGPNFRQITINGTSELLRDARVRRALGMAINRETIARALIGPLGAPPQALGNHLFMANQRGYEDNAAGIVPYDPRRAAALLDEAGWRRQGAGGSPPTGQGAGGVDVRRRDGMELALRLVIPSGVVQSRQEAGLVQSMLAQLGIKVDIAIVPSAGFFEDYVRPGNFDLTIFSWFGDPFLSSNRSLYARPQGGPDGLVVEQNYARVGTAAIDRLFDELTATLDQARAVEIGNEIDRLVWEEGHSITLYQRPEIFAGRATLANFGSRGFAYDVYEDIGFTKR